MELTELDDVYDEQAVAWVSQIERRLARLHLDHRFGAFAAVLSALEYQVEEGEAHPIVVRHLGEALLALAAVHQLPVPAIKDITQTLGLLHGHVAARAQALGR
jgi:hypothetical protein